MTSPFPRSNPAQPRLARELEWKERRDNAAMRDKAIATFQAKPKQSQVSPRMKKVWKQEAKARAAEFRNARRDGLVRGDPA